MTKNFQCFFYLSLVFFFFFFCNSLIEFAGYDQNTYISNVPIAALTVPPSYEEAMTQSPSTVSAVQIPAINRRPSSDTTVASISTAAESDKTDNNSTRQQQSQQLSHLV